MGKSTHTQQPADQSQDSSQSAQPTFDVAEETHALFPQAANSSIPAGTVIAWMGVSSSPPDGWEFCWGQEVPRNDHKYERLFHAIGTSNGQGDGTSTFKLPDLQGMFLRGVNGSRTNEFKDPDAAARLSPANGGHSANAVGSVQADAFQGHQHGSVYLHGPGHKSQAGFAYLADQNDTVATLSTADYNIDRYEGDYGMPRRASETRPKNVYVHYLIKL